MKKILILFMLISIIPSINALSQTRDGSEIFYNDSIYILNQYTKVKSLDIAEINIDSIDGNNITLSPYIVFNNKKFIWSQISQQIKNNLKLQSRIIEKYGHYKFGHNFTKINGLTEIGFEYKGNITKAIDENAIIIGQNIRVDFSDIAKNYDIQINETNIRITNLKNGFNDLDPSVTKNGISWANIGSGGTPNWTSPSNAATQNDAYTLINYNPLVVDEISWYLRGTRFLFSIPSTATINGFLIVIDKKDDSGIGGIEDNELNLVLGGSGIGDNKAQIAVPWTATTDTMFEYGSSTDMWGTTLTPTDVNNLGFGIQINIINRIGGETPKIDHINITVFYTEKMLIPQVKGLLIMPFNFANNMIFTNEIQEKRRMRFLNWLLENN